MATKRISAELKYSLFNLNLSFNLKPSEEAPRAISLILFNLSLLLNIIVYVYLYTLMSSYTLILNNILCLSLYSLYIYSLILSDIRVYS